MTAPRTPGPWTVTEWSGGEGYGAGFYVCRQVGSKTEWLKDAVGARRFVSRESAQDAIDCKQ
jgi:hypothetical protein